MCQTGLQEGAGTLFYYAKYIYMASESGAYIYTERKVYNYAELEFQEFIAWPKLSLWASQTQLYV